MRKYQQLLLVAISVLSITTLLIYHNENGRLKYVLDVVNFFGQQTDHLHKPGDLSYEYTTPFPIWQRIGKGFHAYAAFWHWDPTGGGRGEVTTIVVGLQHAIVSFRCDVSSSAANAAVTAMAGRFGFNREELHIDQDSVPKVTSANGDEYIVYKFICKVPNVTGGVAPQRVSFTDLSTQQRHSIGVRDLTARRLASNTISSTPIAPPQQEQQQQLVACVNLISPLTSALHQFFYAADTAADHNLLEFFYHHHVIGVDEFIVYDNSDRVTLAAKKALAANNVRVNYLPFNFPFSLGSADRDDPKIRHILRLDCELRALNVSQWFVVAQPNDRLYVDGFLHAANSTLHYWNAGGTSSKRTRRLELATNTVCLNTTHAASVGSKTSTIDANVYIASAEDVVRTTGVGPVAGNFVIRRPTLTRPGEEIITDAAAAQRLLAVRALANRYVECRPMDRYAEVTHNTWPATVEPSATRQLMRFVELVRREVLRMLTITEAVV